MDDQQMEAVRRKLERQDERQREHRQQLQQDFARQAELLDSIDRGRAAGRWGLVPAAVLTCYFAVQAGFLLIPFLMVGFVAIAIFAYFVPWVSALTANYWFHGSVISPIRATIVLVLLVDAAFTGWMFLFFAQ